MEFQRARSEAQRDQRRRMILDTTAGMLAEMPVSQVSLNELSRRVGLAKSNVLRYFESREAILLDLLNSQVRGWADEVYSQLGGGAGELEPRLTALAEAFADSMEAHPVMCDLISAQTSVLEHNVSADVALRHKRAIGASVVILVAAVQRALPELNAHRAYDLVATMFVLAAAVWPQSHPSEAVQQVYRDHRDLAHGQLTFADAMRRLLTDAGRGIVARPEPAGRLEAARLQ